MFLMTICSGQLCNQILYLVHVLATAIESKDKRVIDFFAKDVLRFSDLHPEALENCKIRLLSGRVTKLQSFVELFLQRFGFATSGYVARNPRRIRRWMRSCLPKVVWSWCFRNPEAIARHRAAICAFLKVKDQFVGRPQRVMKEARKGVDKVVGVHIRRGDYTSFRSGVLWYSDEQYSNFMKRARMSLGGNIRFVIVSNEQVNIRYFQGEGLDVMDASGAPQEDIVTLSLCDYIMGPSSTFSWWAAYYGDKPRLDINCAACQIDASGFKKVTET